MIAVDGIYTNYAQRATLLSEDHENNLLLIRLEPIDPAQMFIYSDRVIGVHPLADAIFISDISNLHLRFGIKIH